MRTMNHTEWAGLSGENREKMASQLAKWMEVQCRRQDNVFAHLYLQHATRALARQAEGLLRASIATAYLRFRWDAVPPVYVAAEIDDAHERLELRLDVPHHLHDCDECVFLGQFEDEDLYSCEKSGWTTLIARFGSEGRDYRSGTAFIGVDAAITEAAKRKDGG